MLSKHPVKFFSYLAASGMALGLTACGGDGPSVNAMPVPTPIAETVSIMPASDEEGSFEYLGKGFGAEAGHTLYFFDGDTPVTDDDGNITGIVFGCLDTCLEAWPPLLVDSTLLINHAVPDVNVSHIVRPDGSFHVTVQGQPVYLFAEDMVPGEQNGAAVEGWSVVPSVFAEIVFQKIAAVAPLDIDPETFISNGNNECPPDCTDGPAFLELGDGTTIIVGLNGGPTDPGGADGILVTVPGDANGTTAVGVKIARGAPDGQINVFDHETNTQIATIIPQQTSTDWTYLSPGFAGINSEFQGLTSAPLAAGQVLRFEANATFSAGNIYEFSFWGADKGELLGTLLAADENADTLFVLEGNGVNECPPDCAENPVIADPGNGIVQILGLNGGQTNDAGPDRIMIPITADLAGAESIGMLIFRGAPDGNILFYADEGDTMSDTPIATAMPGQNSFDWTSYAQGDREVIVEFSAPLVEGQTLRMEAAVDFAAGNFEGFNFYGGPSSPYSATVEFDGQAMIDGVTGGAITILSNGENECPPDCVNAPEILDVGTGELLLLGLNGIGDGVSITVPDSAVGSTAVGIRLYRGADGGNVPVFIGETDATDASTAVAVIEPQKNSDDWVQAGTGNGIFTYIVDLPEPLGTGDVVTIGVGAQFGAGNLTHVNFYEEVIFPINN